MKMDRLRQNELSREETLDPQDWESFRRLGHRMIDEMTDYLRQVRTRPVWQYPPTEVKESLRQTIPIQGQSQEEIYQEFCRSILPYPGGNIHPCYWGWVNGTGTPFTMLAEMLAAGMNTNCHAGDHSPTHVELQVLEWCKHIFGFTPGAGGVLVSGASMANLIALTVARNAKASNVRAMGVTGIRQRLILYCSTEIHFSIQRAVEILGLGNSSIRRIPVDQNFRIDLRLLERSISEDRRDGNLPFCIVGNAGTVNTGAIDDLHGLADIAQREDLWFHIDGAFGAVAALLPEFSEVASGLARADSLVFDFHKWFYLPFGVACVLFQDEQLHRDSFELKTAYTDLVSHDRGIASGPYAFSNLSIEQGRSFRALKIWFALKETGLEKYRRLIRQNLKQAKYLGHLVESTPDLELLAPVSLNVVCFRYTDSHLSDDQLNRLNKEILMDLHEGGLVAPSFTLIENKYAIRVAIVNHRTRMTDLEMLVQETLRIGHFRLARPSKIKQQGAKIETR